MIITVNTDAAYHSEYKTAGFAFWIVCTIGRICRSGVLKGKVASACEAEMKCILNALHVIERQKFNEHLFIIVNTDSLNSIRVFMNDKAGMKKYRLAWAQKYRMPYVNLCAGLPKHKIEFRHIKSHTHTDSKRNWVNDWCDKAAKEQMWKQINNNINPIQK